MTLLAVSQHARYSDSSGYRWWRTASKPDTGVTDSCTAAASVADVTQDIEMLEKAHPVYLGYPDLAHISEVDNNQCTLSEEHQPAVNTLRNLTLPQEWPLPTKGQIEASTGGEHYTMPHFCCPACRKHQCSGTLVCMTDGCHASFYYGGWSSVNAPKASEGNMLCTIVAGPELLSSTSNAAIDASDNEPAQTSPTK